MGPVGPGAVAVGAVADPGATAGVEEEAVATMGIFSSREWELLVAWGATGVAVGRVATELQAPMARAGERVEGPSKSVLQG